MLFTASTVKDSEPNVRFFVEANLASGVDHMVVFVDAPKEDGQAEVVAFLDAHPHVTCVPTGRRTWWGEDRPGNLNVRQRINANWVRTLLEPFSWAEWMFHVDGDEVARVDRAALSDVPAADEAVWLPPLEAVSTLSPDARPTRFKRLLDDEDLNLLQVLGVVDEPTNQAYFHGHLMGKTGVRPSSGLGLTLHEAVTPAGDRVDPHRDDRLALLHYDAISGAEFVRKWNALAGAGHARYRPNRAPTARALKSLVSRDLPDEVRATYLQKIYESTTLDDVTTLGDLGLLVDVDPLASPATPRDFPAGGREALEARVAELRDAPKRPFFVVDNAKDGKLARESSPGGKSGGLGQRIKRAVRSD